MPKITKRVADNAEIKPAEYFIWDSEVPGFGLRVLPSGRKSYVVQYRAGRRSRRISLGPSTALTLFAGLLSASYLWPNINLRLVGQRQTQFST